jgi:hypothetical protein
MTASIPCQSGCDRNLRVENWQGTAFAYIVAAIHRSHQSSLNKNLAVTGSTGAGSYVRYSFSEPYSYKERRDLVKICTLSSPVLYQITFSNSFPHSLSFISLPSLRPPSRRDITLDAFHAHSPPLQSDPFSKAREDLVLCLTL